MDLKREADDKEEKVKLVKEELWDLKREADDKEKLIEEGREEADIAVRKILGREKNLKLEYTLFYREEEAAMKGV